MLFEVKNRARRKILVNANSREDAIYIALGIKFVRSGDNAEVTHPNNHDQILGRLQISGVLNLEDIKTKRGVVKGDLKGDSAIIIEPVAEQPSELYKEKKFNLVEFFKKILKGGK